MVVYHTVSDAMSGLCLNNTPQLFKTICGIL